MVFHTTLINKTIAHAASACSKQASFNGPLLNISDWNVRVVCYHGNAGNVDIYCLPRYGIVFLHFVGNGLLSLTATYAKKQQINAANLITICTAITESALHNLVKHGSREESVGTQLTSVSGSVTKCWTQWLGTFKN